MIILTLRTDKPVAEIGIFDGQKRIEYLPYQADRQLAETIHQQIHDMLGRHSMDLHNLDALVVYKGPGSFTGLRIGITVANALAYSLEVPIVGVGNVDDWIIRGINRLEKGDNDRSVVPEYGAEPNITSPKK